MVLTASLLAAPSGLERGGARPRNLIFMIPDGCGPASLELARMVADRPLTLDSMLVGEVATASASSRVTDSAAAATAYACGVRTHNRVVGLDRDYRPAANLMELARARGMATGAVATCRIADATPGAFFAHVHRRASMDSVAVQMIERRPDVLFGGGRAHFLPTTRGGARTDSLDLIAIARRAGYRVALTGAEFERLDRAPALALLAPENLSYEIDRDPATQPSLAEMTRRALDLLAGAPRGFVLLVEGSRVDHAGHANDPAAHARETIAYDEAVRVAVGFARRDGRTLVVSVSDHETGGLTLGRRTADSVFYEVRPELLEAVRSSAERMTDSLQAGRDTLGVLARLAGLPEVAPADRHALAASGRRLEETIGELVSRRARVGWTTWGHTAVPVGVHATGPGSAWLGGHRTNAELGRLVAELLGFRLPQPAPARAASGR